MIEQKIKKLDELLEIIGNLRKKNKLLVFTNGVFDILHRGHVEYLEKARSLGDVLVVGLNSDSSVKKIKAPGRPILPEKDRAVILAAIESVNFVCFFDEETPAKIISMLKPDILVKGGDYRLDEIVGRETVESGGGKVVRIPLTKGKSTTNVIGKISQLLKEGKLPL